MPDTIPPKPPIPASIGKRKRRTDPLEKDIERAVCKYATDNGLLQYKFNSMSRAAVPDRIFLTRDGDAFFIEFKRKGQKPTGPQQREHERLREHGYSVFVVDSVAAGKAVIDLCL